MMKSLLPKQPQARLMRHSLHQLPVLRQPPQQRQPLSTTTKASSLEPPPGSAILKWTGEPRQAQAFEQLKARMAETPYAGLTDEEVLKWFLLDRKLNVDEAVYKLQKMHRWRKEISADNIQLADVAREAATGKAYLHAHNDRIGRPVIVVRVARHFTGAAPLIESEKLCVHILDRAMEKLTPETQTMLGVFDLRGFTPRNADLRFVRFLVDCFFTYYPKRLSQVLFVEAPWIFKPSWELVKPWLKKYAALVRFVTVDELRREYFLSTTVPEDFAAQSFLNSSRKK